jgi:hypothetical protein
MNWIRTGSTSAKSECGRYRIDGRLHDHGNHYVATRDERIIVATNDREFAKYRCEADSVINDERKTTSR